VIVIMREQIEIPTPDRQSQFRRRSTWHGDQATGEAQHTKRKRWRGQSESGLSGRFFARSAKNERTAKALVIATHDHIIVGKDGDASLKGMKLI
jgi:hypothetical protein